MSYSIQTDNNLKYYVHFPQGSNGNIHRADDHNFYYTVQSLGTRETFLLMPASQDTAHVWYCVFTTNDSSKHCWGIGTGEDDRLYDTDFTGADSQKFAFVDAGSGHVYILCKGSGKYLFRSDKLYYAHHPIRQSAHKDSSQYLFSLTPRTDKPVYMPTVNAGKLVPVAPYTLAPPPVPQRYQERPAFPAKVFIGETLIPFFNVGQDPDAVGADPVHWQINNHPYYRHRREQQYQYQASSCFDVTSAASKELTHTYTVGVSTTEAQTLEERTSFTLGFTSSKEATIGVKAASVSSSRGFSAQWQKELAVTYSESVTKSVSETMSETLTLNAAGLESNITYIVWQMCDLWTLYYDNCTTRTNDDSRNCAWTAPTDFTTATSYPMGVTATRAEVAVAVD